MTGGEAVT